MLPICLSAGAKATATEPRLPRKCIAPNDFIGIRRLDHFAGPRDHSPRRVVVELLDGQRIECPIAFRRIVGQGEHRNDGCDFRRSNLQLHYGQQRIGAHGAESSDFKHRRMTGVASAMAGLPKNRTTSAAPAARRIRCCRPASPPAPWPQPEKSRRAAGSDGIARSGFPRPSVD